MEVSAKTGKNVFEAFIKMSEQIKEYTEKNLTQNNNGKNSTIKIENDRKDNQCGC
jgi:hypothetical protein